MTTLVALATKDCLVFGCDSLGTTTRDFVDPFDLAEYFDADNDFQMKFDSVGKPLLNSMHDVFRKSKSIPYTHMPHITKIFSLEPLEMAVMLTGISSIGKRTIKSLIEEFKDHNPSFKTRPRAKNYSVQTIAHEIKDFISLNYDKEFNNRITPRLELIIGGYDKREALPKIFRIQFPDKKITQSLLKGEFGMVLGGQMKEIQRIIFGTDSLNKHKIIRRHIDLLRDYRSFCNNILTENKIKFQIPEISSTEIEKFDIFKNEWALDSFDANWGDYSEQNAIECVNFFVNVMIKSQQFCDGMPTVGGEVHIVLITKSGGVQPISREEYIHEGHIVPKHKRIIL